MPRRKPTPQEKVTALRDFRIASGRETRKSHQPKATMQMPSGSGPTGTEPVARLTDDRARTFVKILMAGVPALTAVAYCAPELTTAEGQALTLRAWANDVLVARATVAFNGAEWHDIAPERRVELALDKHEAELAYFLWTHTYETAEETVLEKLHDARKALVELTKGEGSADSAWAKFAKDLIDGRVAIDGPPQLAALPVDMVKDRN